MNKQDLKVWISDNKGKFLALVIAFIYLVIGFFAGCLEGGVEGGVIAFGGILFCLFFPLGLIVLCETIGKPFGGWTDGFGVPNQESPACLFALVGWILLLMPLILMIWKAVFK